MEIMNVEDISAAILSGYIDVLGFKDIRKKT